MRIHLSEGVVLLLLVFDPCGWVGEASFGDEGLAHGSVPTAIFCFNGFELQRLFQQRLLFSTATFRQRLLLAACVVVVLILCYQKGNLDWQKLGHILKGLLLHFSTVLLHSKVLIVT